MKIRACVLLALALAPWLVSPLAEAHPLHLHDFARQKPGPVTLRGIAIRVRSHDFTLQTTSHGSYLVLMTSATQVTEKGLSGRLNVQDQQHVGVRGFVNGRQIRAISVRIYPVKPKPYTLRGTITGARGSALTLQVNGKSVSVQVTSATVVHVGNGPGSFAQIHPGDRVQLRVQSGDGGLLALSVHVYSQRASQRRVELRGTLQSVEGGAVTVRSGSTTYRVRLDGGTVIYLGTTRTSSRALRTGQSVTVHACCAGASLVASSIHVSTTPVARRSTLVRGTVTAITSTTIRIATTQGTVTIALQPSTIYEVGSSRTSKPGVRVGDVVAVRAYGGGRALIAERVHVYAEYRRTRTLSGTVASVSGNALVVLQGGRRYSVNMAPGTPIELNGRPAPASAIHTGDRVRVVGHATATGAIAAGQVSVARAAPKLQTVRGVIASVNGPNLVIVDDFGARHAVRLAPHASVHLHGQPAPPGALFPGAHASARGYLSGGSLVASDLALTVQTRRIKGRVTSVSRSTLALRLQSGTTVSVDLGTTASITDPSGHARKVSIAVGAYAQVEGYVEQSGAVRASTVLILHPSLSVSATVIANDAGKMTIRTTRGDVFAVLFSRGAQISTGASQLALDSSDIPVGARIHVQGTVGSDGTLSVDELTVHLQAVTVPGSVELTAGRGLTIQTSTRTVHVRLNPSTTITQGSQVLALSNLVPGDLVVVYGYGASHGVVLGRKIVVHRPRVGLDGTVKSVVSDGFILTMAGADLRVLVTSSTLFSGGAGAALALGTSVHVSGYRRGDGVILATRVRVGKAPGLPTVSPQGRYGRAQTSLHGYRG